MDLYIGAGNVFLQEFRAALGPLKPSALEQLQYSPGLRRPALPSTSPTAMLAATPTVPLSPAAPENNSRDPPTPTPKIDIGASSSP